MTSDPAAPPAPPPDTPPTDAELVQSRQRVVGFAIRTTDSLKSVRESLCLAQTALGDWSRAAFGQSVRASEVLGRLVEDIDRQRPLGPDGTHGDRYTATCGCEDR